MSMCAPNTGDACFDKQLERPSDWAGGLCKLFLGVFREAVLSSCLRPIVSGKILSECSPSHKEPYLSRCEPENANVALRPMKRCGSDRIRLQYPYIE